MIQLRQIWTNYRYGLSEEAFENFTFADWKLQNSWAARRLSRRLQEEKYLLELTDLILEKVS